MTLAVPGTNQPFSTAVVNANFEAIDTEVGTTRTALTAINGAATTLGGRVTTLEGGAGRGNLARETTASPTTLTAIADGLVGDRVLVIAPGTGVDAFWAELWSTPTSTSSKWRPAETITVDTLAHMVTFIAAWIADTDLTFRLGLEFLVTGTNARFGFVTTAGAYRGIPNGLVKPTAAVTIGGTHVIGDDGIVTITFTGAGNCIITNLFPPKATYGTDVYELEESHTGGTSTIDAKVAAAGVADASAVSHDIYGPSNTQAGVSGGAYTSLATTKWLLTGGGSNLWSESKLELRHIGEALVTQGTGSLDFGTVVGTTASVAFVKAGQRASTVWDGIQIISSAACTVTVKSRAKL